MAEPDSGLPWRGGTSHERFANTQFVRWTDALGERFFNYRADGKPVWLTVTESLIHNVANGLRLSGESFVESLVLGPPWETRRGELCQQALWAASHWRARRFPYPPYLGYLCLFSLAAATETGDPANAYYPRLWTQLGQPGRRGTPPRFDDMAALWEDLQHWSLTDMGGQLGKFRAVSVGMQRHIGFPIAQQLLTPRERTHLPEVFLAAKLADEGVPPPDDLAQLLVEHSGRVLEASTIRLLRSQGQSAEADTLLDQVRDILTWWRAEKRRQPRVVTWATPVGAVRPVLRLTLQVDRVAGTASAALRLRLPVVPVGGLVIDTPGGQATAQPAVDGWSTRLVLDAGHPLSAVIVGSWLEGMTLASVSSADRFKLPAARVRVLGTLPGLPGITELDEMPQPPFTVLVHDKALHRIYDLQGNAELQVSFVNCLGLQNGWHLADVKGGGHDALEPLLPHSRRKSVVRLVPDGGLTSGPGSRHFFTFARPRLHLTGAPEGTRVLVRGAFHELSKDGYIVLPEDEKRGQLTAVAWSGDDAVAQCIMHLGDGCDWREYSLALRRRAIKKGLPRDPLLAPGVNLPIQGLLVGRTPGQAVRATESPDWAPVWLVQTGRPPIYCGSGIPHRDVPTGIVGSAVTARTRWTSLFEGLPPPARAVERSLWEEYRIAARGQIPHPREWSQDQPAISAGDGVESADSEPSAGDLLLWALTGCRSMSKVALSRALESLTSGDVQASDYLSRHEAHRWLVALGHCESDDTGLSVLSPQLVELPGAGLPEGVLCGARSPRTLSQLIKAAALAGGTVHAERQTSPLAATRLRIAANGRNVLRNIAEKLGIRHQPYPLAFSAAEQTPALSERLAQLDWAYGSDPNWPRRDFDPTLARFLPPAQPEPGSLRLSEYTNPTSNRRVHFLWQGGRFARIDREWGRVAAACAGGSCVLSYAKPTRLANVPVTVPLPVAIDRALVMCTGLVPEKLEERRLYYGHVTPELADLLARKTCIHPSTY